MKKVLLLCCVVSVVFASCTNSLERISEKPVKKIESRAAVDGGTYIDVTLKDRNARLYTKEDFASLSRGLFVNNGSYIDIDYSEGKVQMFTQDCQIPQYKGKTFDCSFIYDIKAASSDCIYLGPSTKTGINVCIDGKNISAIEAPCFCLFLPMYGFGSSRIEVSPVLNGEIALPSGTYWKRED